MERCDPQANADVMGNLSSATEILRVAAPDGELGQRMEARVVGLIQGCPTISSTPGQTSVTQVLFVGTNVNTEAAAHPRCT